MTEAHDPLVTDLLWLCGVSSFTGEEKALCDALEARFRTAQLAGPVRRYGDSLVLPVTRGTGGPRIALCGHLDVVRTEHDGPPRIQGDRLFGPGAADMKSGVALMLDLLDRGREDLAGVDLTSTSLSFTSSSLGRRRGSM